MILPERLEGIEYFKHVEYEYSIDPRNDAIRGILKMARADKNNLFHGEFKELYEYSRKKSDEKCDNK